MKPFNRSAWLRSNRIHSRINIWRGIAQFVLLTIAIVTLAFSTPSDAQDQEPSLSSVIEVARAGMQADRATIITTAMNFTDQEAAAFWPIYRRYEYERSKLDDGRVLIIKEYTSKYPTLTDSEAKAMAERMFEYDSRQTALKKTYFKKLNKVLPALTVTKFFQVERRVDLLMDMNVEATLPPLTQAQYAESAK